MDPVAKYDIGKKRAYYQLYLEYLLRIHREDLEYGMLDIRIAI